MRTPSPPPYMHHGQSEAPGADDHAIRRLLGHDLDAYASAHVSTYEASKTRWSECTIEEWKDGADGTVFLLGIIKSSRSAVIRTDYV